MSVTEYLQETNAIKTSADSKWKSVIQGYSFLLLTLYLERDTASLPAI